jgi:hypothetical protein
MRTRAFAKIFLLVFLTVAACKHASIRDIQGRIEDENGNPLEGASVILRYHVPDGGLGSKSQYHYDSLTTDASGKYRFNRRKKMAWEHWLIVSHPDFKTQWFNLVGDRNPANIKMEFPTGYLSIRIKKNTSVPAKITVSVDQALFSTQYSGPYDSMAVISRKLFARITTVGWDVNDTIHHNASVTLQKGENTTFLIEYD